MAGAKTLPSKTIINSAKTLIVHSYSDKNAMYFFYFYDTTIFRLIASTMK